MNNTLSTQILDLLIVGGGINGAGIAADAAGRGLNVTLCEQNDFASATSSASSKLIHGGLRYLEHYEFRLVKEALTEREVLLEKAPHLIKPLRFVLPHQKHLRPAWMIRCGLFLYDNLGGRKQLEKSKSLTFKLDSPLKPEIKKGFEYADCWVDDARLVIVNVMAAQEKGAQIDCYTKCISAVRHGDHWQAELQNTITGDVKTVKARALINASGPWAQSFLEDHVKIPSPRTVRLIKGSHIIVPKLYEGDHAYILQNQDKRVIFAIPYLKEFTLIGTTDKAWEASPENIVIDNDEKDYLVDIINHHFKKQISSADILHHYAGVRPLCDDESDDPSAMTRDYTLEVQDDNGKAPLLSVFGGKITTYRRLAEAALEKLQPYFADPDNEKPDNKTLAGWTKHAPLPGGEIHPKVLLEILSRQYSWLEDGLSDRLIHTYGSRCLSLLGNAQSLSDLGPCLGGNLYEREVIYLIKNEWARSSEDVLLRRTKLGLFLSQLEQLQVKQMIQAYLADDDLDLKTA
jgi:glycerol-3-phosphate dehydrogenase